MIGRAARRDAAVTARHGPIPHRIMLRTGGRRTQCATRSAVSRGRPVRSPQTDHRGRAMQAPVENRRAFHRYAALSMAEARSAATLTSVRTRSGDIARWTVRDLPPGQAITSVSRLLRSGWTRDTVRAQLDAHRWQRCGRALVMHNGPLHPDELAVVALENAGPRAALTAFTAAQQCGLQGWERDAIHVLVPAGARVCRPPGLRMRIHWSGDWRAERVHAGRHALAPALVVAASTFAAPRPACGLLAAAVQQRLLTAERLRTAITASPRTRHRHALRLAVEDVDQRRSCTERDRLCEAVSPSSPARAGPAGRARRAIGPAPLPRRRMDHPQRTTTRRGS